MDLARRTLLAGGIAAGIAGCAALAPPVPVNVNVVGLEPLPGEGLEGRLLVKLRVQNPGDRPLEFDGVSLELDLRGSRFATGVADGAGTVPRFGETVIAVPVSIPVSALVRQVLGIATGDRSRVDYRLRGRFGLPGFGSVPFDAQGELTLPPGLSGTARD